MSYKLLDSHTHTHEEIKVMQNSDTHTICIGEFRFNTHTHTQKNTPTALFHSQFVKLMFQIEKYKDYCDRGKKTCRVTMEGCDILGQMNKYCNEIYFFL